MSSRPEFQRLRQMLLGALILSAASQFVPSSAQAQQATRAPRGETAAASCDPARSLGVSRTYNVDGAKSSLFGHQQYKDVDFLADGEVVLTFDDGPLRVHTQAVINALDSHCTKATFFMVGSQALADPDMVRQVMRRGHNVGTHTWSHKNLRQMTPLAARQEIELGFSAVTQAAGQPITPFFRFPFLADTKAMKSYAETRKFGVFSIEVDALDYRNKENPQAVHDQVMSQLAYQKKGILLFHDIQPSTAAALPAILRSLKAKGYRVVHLASGAKATTLPEFDQMANRESGRKRVASAASPLANRALTHPLPSPQSQAAPSRASGAAQPTPPIAPGSTVPPAANTAASPPLLDAGPQIPQIQPRPPRPRREEPESDWRARILHGN